MKATGITFPVAGEFGRGRASGWGAAALFVLLSLPVVLVFGAIAGMGNVLFAVVLFGLIVGLVLLSKPVWMLWLLMAIVLVVHGLVQFFLDFGQLQWIASALGVALLLAALFVTAIDRSRQQGFAPLSALAFLFMLLLTISTVIDSPRTVQILVGIRTYLPYWGVFAVLLCRIPDERTLQRMLWALVVVAMIQWPVELYQKIFVVQERTALGYFGSAWDSIVGTFGGTKFGGGASGSLAVYVTAMAIVVLAWWKHGVLKAPKAVLIGLNLLLAIGLSETKAVFILLPVGGFILYRADLLRRPARFVFGSIGVVVLLAAILAGYYKLFWEDEHTRGSIVDAIESRFAYSFDPTFMPTPDWPGRLTGLFIWAKHHSFIEEPLETVIGHGAASATTLSTVMGMGDAAKRYGSGLDVTGVTKLLWESGLLGTLVFFSVFVVAYFQAGRLSLAVEVPKWHRASLTGTQAAMPLIALALFYEATAVSSPPMQFLAMFLLGYVGYWYNRVRQRS